MNSVLVGMFDTQAEASAAQSKLLAAGFAAGALRMTGATDASTGTSTTTGTAAATTAPHQEGAIARFFDHLFGSDDDDLDVDHHKSTYGEAFRRGSYGLTVETASEGEMVKAEQILNAAGAIDVDERSEAWRNEGWTGAAANVGTGATAGANAAVETGTPRKLQEVEEQLQVGKRAVARGGVRVFTRMTEVPVEESVTLREERAAIKRTAVDRVASAADLEAFKEGSIEVRETGEEAVVSKTARVTGEVEVGKTATEREETIRDTVRQTKVEVETIDADRSGTVGRN